jgi:hypothetical protein
MQAARRVSKRILVDMGQANICGAELLPREAGTTAVKLRLTNVSTGYFMQTVRATCCPPWAGTATACELQGCITSISRFLVLCV